MDISEVWPFATLAALAVMGWIAFRAGRRLRSRWLRVPVRIAGSVSSVAGLCLLVFLSVLDLNCTVRTPAVPSPDGMHVALRSYAEQGALGADYASISLRRTWYPRADEVFFGAGWVDRSGKNHDPAVRWLDSSHLEIRHIDAGVRENRCGQRVDGVEIVCVKVPPTSS
ncbi:MAG: hypothetical protein ABI972_23660 [Acidobacteriota bacterium]